MNRKLVGHAHPILRAVALLATCAAVLLLASERLSIAEGASAASPAVTLKLYLPLALHDFNAPGLLNPTDGTLLARATFDWTDVVGATGYQFQLSATNNFATLLVNQPLSASQFTFTSALTGTHYWRVYAITPSGPSAYSSVGTVQLVDYNADDDGDSLRNGWELHGYDADGDGVIDVDLPALGASYRHKDIFVQMDYMVRASAANGLAPNQNVINSIIASFSNAPLTNPDGVTGVKIHPELTNQVPYDDTLNPAATEFNTLKAAYFNPKRAAVYHYMIWANQYGTTTSSGYSFAIPGTSFMVTLGTWHGGNGGTDNEKIGTFIHELGHDLGLRHGGGSNDLPNYKPNYISVMNYLFQITGLYRGGIPGTFDYQRFALPALNETSLSESLGLNAGSTPAGYDTAHYCVSTSQFFLASPATGPIDWNCNGSIGSTGSVDVNNDGALGLLAATPNDWTSIVFNGGGVIGSGLTPRALADWMRSSQVDPHLQELTFEQQQVINEMMSKSLKR